MEKVPGVAEKRTAERLPMEATFDAYVESLDLTHEDFEKDILDVGSGFGDFATWARDHGLSTTIVSLDKNRANPDVAESVMGRAEELPFKDASFDLVISNCSVPNLLAGETEADTHAAVSKSIREMLRVARPGGEVRLGSVIHGTAIEKHKMVTEALDKTLGKLTREYDIEMIHTPPDLYKTDAEGNEIEKVAERYLIKIKRISALA